MKKLLNETLGRTFSVTHKLTIPTFKGEYFISGKPNYLSQFVRILPPSIKVDEPLTNKEDIEKYGAKDSEEFTFWAWRNCGIICVKMILDAKKVGKNKTIMDLTREGIDLGGYITFEDGKLVDKGWFHSALSSLLNKYGIKSYLKKWQTIESVAKDILNNKYVIISVRVPGRSSIKNDGSFDPKKDAKYGGHLVLATGVKMNGKRVEGIYVHDPRGLETYQEDTWIPAKTFKKIFSSRTIVAH